MGASLNLQSLWDKSESSSAGRARPCQGRGRGFESRLSLKTGLCVSVIRLLALQTYFYLKADHLFFARVVELVDTQDLKSCGT